MVLGSCRFVLCGNVYLELLAKYSIATDRYWPTTAAEKHCVGGQSETPTTRQPGTSQTHLRPLAARPAPPPRSRLALLFEDKHVLDPHRSDVSRSRERRCFFIHLITVRYLADNPAKLWRLPAVAYERRLEVGYFLYPLHVTGYPLPC